MKYTNESREHYSVKAEGEKYSSIRENSGRVFLADPYHKDNFADSLADDIKTITETPLYGIVLKYF